MPYQRKRRSASVPPSPMDDADERVYTEEDYAVPSADEPLDEWDASPSYLSRDEADAPDKSFAPDERFAPDESFIPDDSFAPDADERWADTWHGDPFSVPGSFDADPYEDDLLDEEELLDDDLLTDEELAELRRSNWKLLAGLADFAGVILGTAAILVTVALLVSLLNWLIADVSQSFVLLQKNF